MRKLNLPVTPDKGRHHIPANGDALLNPAFCRTIIGILLMRNEGKTLTFSQADFDRITGLHVVEGWDDKGRFLVALGYPEGRQG